MKIFYITSSIVLASLIGLTGCASTTPQAPKVNKNLKGTVQQLAKMAPHKTEITLNVSDNSLNIEFPKLQNNTGENFTSTVCGSTFTYVGSSQNSLLDVTTHVYKGTFNANNNCALFTEQPSKSFESSNYTQYAILKSSENGWSFSLAKDKAGELALIKGDVR